MPLHVPERHRITTGRLATNAAMGNNGMFFLPNPQARTGPPLAVIASDGMLGTEDEPHLAGWEHVSVSLPHRCPTWEEMAHVKSVFWDRDDCVVQYHPPESEYVNTHPFCLHLWRPIHQAIPLPPKVLV